MLNPQALCQLEFHTVDLEASLRFFAATFGWQPVPITLHEYVVLAVPDDCPFGISLVSHGPQASSESRLQQPVVPYFRWEGSVETLLTLVTRYGGRVLGGPRLIPGYGQVYNLVDPGGIQLGIFGPS
ncbi:MAG: VOC family protein [Oligoflexus sp.]|jgi:predicted enzyme related to lactoylglutathione lyase